MASIDHSCFRFICNQNGAVCEHFPGVQNQKLRWRLYFWRWLEQGFALFGSAFLHVKYYYAYIDNYIQGQFLLWKWRMKGPKWNLDDISSEKEQRNPIAVNSRLLHKLSQIEPSFALKYLLARKLQVNYCMQGKCMNHRRTNTIFYLHYVWI